MILIGKSWCKRFHQDHCPTFKFAMKTQAEKVKNKILDSNMWQEEIKRKILDINGNKLIPSSDNIFLIECQSLSLDREAEKVHHTRCITLMVIIFLVFSLLKLYLKYSQDDTNNLWSEISYIPM